jgi:uncharacterized protein
VDGYVSGLYEVNQTKLYVTRGIGMMILPARLFAPPEIVVVTLRRKQMS